MKKLPLLFAVSIAIALLGSSVATAQENERVVTGTFNYMTPSHVEVLDEYISSQLYQGGAVFTGLNVNLGSVYKKNQKVSWDLYYTQFSRNAEMVAMDGVPKLMNPAKTQYLNYQYYNFGYGSYYHWNFGNKLKVKAGGVFDVYGSMKTSKPDGVNNFLNMEAQIMVKALGAVKYGWDFKKWALDIHGKLSLPVFGVISADHPSEPAMFAFLGNDHNVMDPTYNHVFMAFYHNYMSLDYEVGVDFVFRPFTITLGLGSINKWWNVYDVQNFRKINYATIGISFDLALRNKFKSTINNF